MSGCPRCPLLTPPPRPPVLLTPLSRSPCRFQHLDFVYLNAGIMPNPHVNFKALWKGLLTG